MGATTSGAVRRGFPGGADIKMLSQFAAEDEVLFPPCTMFEVLTKPPPEVSATTYKVKESLLLSSKP